MPVGPGRPAPCCCLTLPLAHAQLVVRGCADVQASFEKYCEVECMEGDNQYNAGDAGHGMQACLTLT